METRSVHSAIYHVSNVRFPLLRGCRLLTGSLLIQSERQVKGSLRRMISRVPATLRQCKSPHPGKSFIFVCFAAALAGCAQQPVGHAGHGREYFSSDIYGAASPRVIADGAPVPHGGGQYLVGRPYTVAGRRYYPSEQPHLTQVGSASYYGAAFHGRRTANGEIYDMASISAAHPTMPLPSYVRVTNLGNSRSIVVRVNDRGPFHSGRVIDVSQRVADALDFRRMGTAQVKIEYLGRAGLQGSDDAMLLASLRTDGRPASLNGLPNGAETMVASADPSAKPAPAQRLAMFQPEAPETPPLVAQHRNLAYANAPLPPARPFDLGTVPGADAQISVARMTPPNPGSLMTVVDRGALSAKPQPRPTFVQTDFATGR